MNIVVTAGGTKEPIDDVRSITNTGTGNLGSMIADCFAAQKTVENIFYICADTAVKPTIKEKIIEVPIGGTLDLKRAVEKVMTENKIDVVIHSMAVSDYCVRAVSDIEKISECLERQSVIDRDVIYQAIDNADMRIAKDGKLGKLSSDITQPIVLLEKTPKVLPIFKELSPSTVVVGFKLLSGVSRDELFDVARGLMSKSGCDMVLANDTAYIKDGMHKGFLLSQDKILGEYETKSEIAKGLSEILTDGKGLI